MRTPKERRATCRFRLLSMVFLVCLVATSADAQTDLLWQHSDGRLAVWTLQGTNSLSGDPLGRLPDPLWQISAVADFNGDNQRDLVFQHQGDGRLAVWLMNGRTQVAGLAPSPSQVSDLNWKVRGAGDFNGDSRPDLIWQNEVTGQISAWLMDGTTRPDGNGRLLSPSVVQDTDWRIVGVADFNLDGHPDLLWQHQSSGLISVWHMNGLRMTDGVVLSPDEFPDPNVKLRAVGDVNGDQWPDLVLQNEATGLLSAWLMKDVQHLGEVLLSPDHVTDTNWRIVGTGLLWNYSGVYTLTITARSCSAGFPEAAKRRVYTALVEQTAANLRVSLSDADFLFDPDDPSGSRTFVGSVSSTGKIVFNIEPLSVWDYGGPDLEERLSDGTVLMIFGAIYATGTPAGISGTAGSDGAGGIVHLPPRGPAWSLNDATGWCQIDRFEMVRR